MRESRKERIRRSEAKKIKKTMNDNMQVEDQMLFNSELYPSGLYYQMAPSEGETTRSRGRRRKSKGEAKGVVGGGQSKRKLSSEQVDMLERNFGSQHKLECERKNQIASQLGLDPRQVAVWFQNRRARWKSKKLEEEYSTLKTRHESMVVEKCRLETQVVELQEKVSQADKEIKWLSERLEEVSSSSSCSNTQSSSSLHMDLDQQQHYLGEFGVIELGNLFYVPENGTDQWVNNYI